MACFAVIAPPFTSHIRALEAVAAELIARGHRVVWLQQPDVQALLREPRIEFVAVGQQSFPAGSLARIVAHAAHPGGPLGLRRVIRDMTRQTTMLCQEALPLLREHGVDVVIADQMEAAGGLVAAALRLPWVSVACALPINREPALPLPVMPWGPARADDAAALQRNVVSTRIYDWLMGPHDRAIADQAAAMGLSGRTTLIDCLSPCLQVSQTIEAFDFPRRAAPAALHPVGPLRLPLVAESALELNPVDDARPLVFASLGTLQGGRFGLFKRIAKACRALDVQLLLAHCGGLDAAQSGALVRLGARWVTDFAPQRAALGRADVVITHAGLNTVLDALVAGTPMLLLPIAFDQAGVAARVLHAQAGLRLLPALASTRAITRALRRLLDEPTFAAQAEALGQQVPAGDAGTRRAADLIEAMARTAPGGPDECVAQVTAGVSVDAATHG
ncbi:MAG: glycosyltransferase [Burkholderiaceae bacterium]